MVERKRPLPLRAARLSMLALVVFGASACAESNFDLSEESRLPRWFKLQDGLSRSDVSATLDVYANGTFEVRLFGPDGEALAEVDIPIDDQVRIDQYEIRGYRTGNIPQDQDPSYYLTTANGLQEVIEFPGRAMFRLVDDPVLLKKLEPVFAAKKGDSAKR